MIEEIKNVLSQSFPNIRDLCNDEITEITGFMWLWSAFEAKHCKCNANRATLTRLAASMPEINQNAWRHFQCRYILCDDAQTNLDSLIGGRGANMRTDIETGLCHNATFLGKKLALAFIVYRLRNNLFHGEKGRYGFNDQLENFKHANALLVYWLSLPHEPSTSA